MKTPANGGGAAPPATANVSSPKGEKKSMNGELWQGCAGPLVNLPVAGTHVVYFPQGHSEQVAASMKKNADAQIPNYPNLPSKLICFLHSVILHADTETDEVYAQMTLQPVPSIDKESLFRSDLSMKVNNNKPQNEFFCKTLTASDTSSHGGFSVPRRAAERIFPPLDFSMQPPAQEIVATDLHGSVWTFRHVYRGQPKRHLLTSGWSLFVSGKRLFAGDSVLFIRDEKQQLLLGIRRANRQPANLSLSVLSSDSMHIGVLAAAAHAAANYSPFTVFYNPRTSHSEFVIPLAKYYNAVYANQISVGMQFRMMFETEESGTKRHVGMITGVSDLDPLRWKSSQWRNLQVGWDDESSGRERRHRVSIWEIEPVTSPFFICPTPFFGTKRPRQQDDDLSDLDGLFKRTMPWLRDEFSVKEQHAIPGLSLVQWMNMQHNPSLTNTTQPNYLHSLAGSQVSQPNDIQFNSQMPSQHMQPQQQFTDSSQQARQSFINQQQHSKMTCHHSDPINQQLQIPENQTQIQLLKKLQQQQQLLLSQQTTLQPPSQLSQLLDISNSFSGSIATSQIHDVPGMRRSNSQTNLQFSQPSQQPAPVGHNVPLLTNQLSATDGGQLSVLSDDVPSCSTSPSMNNLQPKSDDKTSLIISKSQNQGFLAPQVYNNNSSVPQMETLDNSSSSVTSVCLSLDEKSVNPKHYVEAQDNQRNNMPFSDYQLGSEKDYSNYLSSSGGMLYNYENPKEGNPQLLSSIVSQSFGVPDIAFNSITSTIDDTSFIDRGAWAPKPPMPRMRTYTKVYKRGAVGRSIDIARYSGYEELKQDLARRFGIEGQLEDGQRIGWKLVYMDQESDVLLVGDDPWEEFVNCVNCIKILSHQEVQQMSLDGNSGNIVLPNQAACSGSDDGNV